MKKYSTPTEPYFILPDSMAGDAKELIFISINGTVYTLNATMVTNLIDAGMTVYRLIIHHFDMGSEASKLAAALAPFSNDPTDFIDAEASRANDI